MRVVVFGDRNWTDGRAIRLQLLEHYDEIEVVIEGEARGADRLSRVACEHIGLPFEPYPYIGELGRAGGPVRNQQMIDEGKPTHGWLFHDDIEISVGSKDMMGRLLRAGIPVRHYKHGRDGLIYKDISLEEICCSR